jgi:hypothetical protein
MRKINLIGYREVYRIFSDVAEISCRKRNEVLSPSKRKIGLEVILSARFVDCATTFLLFEWHFRRNGLFD